MFQERINAYEASLTVKDKPTYVKPARMCAEFFDGRGVDSPNAEDWIAFREYVREEYYKEHSKELSDRTLKVNYEGRAKRFMCWCSDTTQPELMSEEQAQPAQTATATKAPAVDAQPVRVNFMLDAQTHETLSVLAIMERRTLTAIMKDAAAMYIKEHSEQAGILSAAFQQARSKDGQNTQA